MPIEMTRDELEFEILRRVQEDDCCAAVEGIRVQPVESFWPSAPNWRLFAIIRSEPSLQPNCYQRVEAVIANMRETHRLIGD